MEIPKDKEDLESNPERFQEYVEAYNIMWAKLDALLEQELENVHERIHNGEILIPNGFTQKRNGEIK